LSLSYGPRAFGRYDERGGPLLNPKLAAGKAVEKRRGGKVQKPTFPPRLEIPQTRRGFPTAGGCGRLTKPDISLATKSGRFNLLTTHWGDKGRAALTATDGMNFECMLACASL
jgi:hypothetical protein